MGLSVSRPLLRAASGASDAHQRTKGYLNVHFKTFQDVQDSEEFDELVSDASQRNSELKGKVRLKVRRLDYCLIQLS